MNFDISLHVTLHKYRNYYYLYFLIIIIIRIFILFKKKEYLTWRIFSYHSINFLLKCVKMDISPQASNPGNSRTLNVNRHVAL